MSVWKVIYTTLRTGEIVGELPAKSFTFTDALNADGTFSVEVQLVTTTPTGRLTNDISAVQLTDTDLAPGMTGVHFQRDNSLVWSGVVWGVSADVAANTLTISGRGFLSYFKRRFVTVDTTFSSVDQLTIARSLIDTAAGNVGGTGADIKVKTGETATSGRTRDRTFLGYERRNVGELLEQLSNVDDGFDFRFDPGYVSDDIEIEFRTMYPATGRRTNHVLEIGTNVQMLGYQSSGAALTNSVTAIGGGDGEDLPLQVAQDPAGLSSRPLLETVLALSDVTVDATLVEHAKRAITRGSEPMVTLSVAVFADEIPVLGSYDVGDQVFVRGTYGYVSLSNWFRITSIAVQVATTGSETVILTLVPLGVFND